MSARGAPQAASYSKGLVLAVLVDVNKLSLRELVLCFMTCKTFRELLEGRGFCIGTAWLCAYLESGRSPAEILSRLRSARRSVAYERPLSRVDQVTSFLVRHEEYGVRWGWAWAQLLYQEPDGGVLCEGVKKMLWMLKGRLVKELHKCSGYYPCLYTWTVHSKRLNSVAWSPCGKFVASGSCDHTIKILDVEAGKCSLKGHSGNPESSVKCLAAMQSYFMRENCYPFVGDEGGWMELDGDGLISKGHLEQLLLDPDLNLGQNDIEALDVESLFAYLLTLDESQGESVRKDVFNKALEQADTSAITYNPNSRLKCTLKGHTCTGECICKKENEGEWNEKVVVNPECPVRGHSHGVTSVAWSPCGKFVASGSKDKTIKIWHAETGSEKCSLKGHSEDNPECTCNHHAGTYKDAHEANPECPVTGHSHWVSSVEWSPCGNFVASGSWDNTIKIWDVEAGSEKYSLTGHSKSVYSVAWSPCGKFVASGGGDKTIKIWHAETGSEKCSLTGYSRDVESPNSYSGWVTSVAWSPDGRLVASGSLDKTIRIWDVATGKEVMGLLRGHLDEVFSVAWSPCGNFVASGSRDGTVKVWDIQTGSEKCSLRGHSHGVTSVAWSPCGKIVASGSWDNTIKIWHAETGSEKCSLTRHSWPVYSVAWSPDGRLVASGSKDRTIRIWDAATGKEVMGPLKGHSNTVTSVVFSPDGKQLASGSWDNTIRIWDVATGKEVMGPLTEHSKCVNVAWSPDSKLVASCSDDWTIRIWDVATGKEVMGPLRGHSKNNPECTCNHDWGYKANPECPVKGHSDAVTSVAWSPDSKLVASGSSDMPIRIWDVATGKEVMGPLKGHSEDNPECTCNHHAGTYKDTYEANPECPVKGHSKDNPECTCKHGKMPWDYKANPECPVTGHSRGVTSVALSPDSKLVASGSYDMTIRIWDVATGKEVMGLLKGHSAMVTCVAWSPDGKQVASCSWDTTVRIWDVSSGKEAMGPLTGHLDWVISVAWSPDGKLVASGSNDSTIRIWDAATGMETMAPLMGLPSSWVDVGPEVRALAQQVWQASDDLMACAGNYVVTADKDTVIICEVLEGRESDDESDDEQETEPVAMFRCPSRVHAVACRPPYICAGCVGRQVLLLEAPFLCEGPGI